MTVSSLYNNLLYIKNTKNFYFILILIYFILKKKNFFLLKGYII